ncbi:MAG: hypothetical protein AB7V13_02780 [Pseudorhodoplanes sp.]
MKQRQVRRLLAAVLLISAVQIGELHAAELGPTPPQGAPGAWTFSFTTYAWTPWISGDATVKGRSFDVDITPSQVLDALDWSGIPAWFSYVEARNGRVSLFNDIAYAQLTGSGDFAKTGPLGIATLSGNVRADYEQAVVELGAAYEIWSGVNPGLGAAAIDVLAGGRYWHQDAAVSADVALNPPILGGGGRVFVRSGSVDWVDPFIGARLRQQLAPGQTVTVRGDIGGFGAGSDFSWQAITTYNFELCATDRYNIDGYLGYRALSVDYSEGSGTNLYEYNAVQHGPVLGATVRF